MKYLMLALVVLFTSCTSSTPVFARFQDEPRYSHSSRHGYNHGDHRGRDSAIIGGALVTGLVLGAVIATIPQRHDVVYVRGTRYYHSDGHYYQDDPRGYVVVKPVVVESNSVSISIPNQNGSYTIVMLVRNNNGFIGPQGEFYPVMPSVEQLKVMYSK